MDDLVRGAITAVSFDDEHQAVRWFEALVAVNRTSSAIQDWDAFMAALRAEAGAAGLRDDQLDEFERYLAEWAPAPADLIAALCDEPDLYGCYQQAARTYDKSAWIAFLSEHGPYWDGADATWPAFREWFAYQAGASGLAEPAGQFLDYVENAPDRLAAMAEYGVSIAASHLDQQPNLDQFPILARLAAYEATEEAMMRFVRDETGIDLTERARSLGMVTP